MTESAKQPSGEDNLAQQIERARAEAESQRQRAERSAQLAIEQRDTAERETKARRQAESREREAAVQRAMAVAKNRTLRRRSTFLLLAVSAAFGLAVAATALYAVSQRRQAAEARDGNQRIRAETNALLDHFLNRVVRTLEAGGNIKTLNLIGENTVTYFENLDSVQPGGPDFQLRHAKALQLLGKVRRGQGRWDESQDCFSRSVEILGSLPREIRLEGQTAMVIARSYNGMGSILERKGDLAGAQHLYDIALRVMRRAVERETGDANRLRHDLWNSHANMGRILKERGDWHGALGQFHTAMSIVGELAEANPENLLWQNDLAISHLHLGSIVETASGDMQAALQHYSSALDIMRRLAQNDPFHADWQRVLATCHNYYANILKATGQIDQALEHYQSGLDVMVELIERDPLSLNWQRDLLMSRYYTAVALEESGQTGQALEQYEALLDLIQTMNEKAPGNLPWRRDLMFCHFYLGAVSETLGDSAKAQENYETALEIARSTERQLTIDYIWRRQMAIIQTRSGAIALHGDDASGAEEFAEAARENLDKAIQTHPEDASTQAALGDIHILRGEIHRTEDRDREARLRWRKALACLAPLQDQRPLEQFAAPYARALLLLGKIEEARLPASRLRNKGFGNPAFWSFCEKNGLTFEDSDSDPHSEDSETSPPFPQ